MSYVHLESQACTWCGWHEIIQCSNCKHTSCDSCDAGGYCDCDTTK